MATKSDPEWYRHHTTRAGHDFRDAIWLDGYDNQSIWGYDTGVGSFFAQVWSNDSGSEEPDLWLTPPDLWATWPHVLVPPIVAFTGRTPLSVVRGLGVAAPNQQLVDEDELQLRHQRHLNDIGSECAAGQARALDWVLGGADASPSSATPVDHGEWSSPEQVEAEALHAAGVLTLVGGAQVSGVEEALLTSLVVR